MKLAFKTFGCRANSVDTDILWAEASKRGFEIVPEDTDADAYIINSCTVTETADKSARYQIRKYKNSNPKAVVGIIGCYAQVASEEICKTTDADFVVGTANKSQILNLIQSALANNEFAQRNQVEKTSGFLTPEFHGTRLARASLKIQDGCNFSCTFCIIPEARGRSRSLPLETVVDQAKQAYSQGFEEIVLTGIHIAHYGWDHNTDLTSLVRKLLELDGPRIRLSTLDPFEVPDELLALMSQSKKFCPYFHIALQSGDDSILKAMKRIYRADEFDDCIERIKRANKDSYINVDIIAGFPRETDAHFQNTVDRLNRTDWTKLHVFPYSERRGTTAALLDSKVPAEVISQRVQALLQLSEQRLVSYMNQQIGKTVEVVLEKKKRDGSWSGHSENYLPVRVECPGARKSKVTCKITQIYKQSPLSLQARWLP